MQESRRKNLFIACAAAAACAAACYDVIVWLGNYISDPFHNDFTFYYAAARLGLQQGWGHLYDLALQQQQLNEIGSHIRIAQLARYVSPPPLAWLVTPLTALPFQLAYWVWIALLGAALWLTWFVAAPGRGRARIIFLAAALGWLPVIYGLYLAQPVLLVAGSVAVCYALLRRDRQVLAGAALGLIVLKPQLALLVPAALLVSGRWRAFGAAAVTLAVLAVLSAFALGDHGVATYEQRLAFATTVPENQALTLAAWIHNLQLTRAVQVLISAWTLLLAYRLRSSRGIGVVLGVALVGGFVASPYAHWDDMAMLGLAGWLLLSDLSHRWAPFYFAGLVIAAELFPLWGAGPVLAGCLGALVLLSIEASRGKGRGPWVSPDDGRSVQQTAGRPAAPRPTSGPPDRPDARPAPPLRG